MAWTKKERVLAVLNGELPDRIPIFDLIVNDDVLEHVSGKKPIAVGDRETVIRAASQILDICHPADTPNEIRKEALDNGNIKVYERWTSWELPQEGKTQEHLIRQIKREIEEKEAYSISEDEIRIYKKNVRQYNRWAGDMLYIGYDNKCPILPGTVEEGIFIELDEPELVRRWNKASNLVQMQKLQALADKEDTPVMINFNDIAMKGSTIHSPELLDELFFPYLHQVCDIAHSKGIKVIYHTDGYLGKVMDRIIACGVDALHPIDISAGMSYSEFKGQYGKKTIMVGGMDGVNVLALGSVDDVVRETRRLLTVGGKNGGLIVASSTGQIDASMPLQNILAYYETILEYGRYG